MCTQFSHVQGLERLTHEALNASYLTRGELVRNIRRALGGGRSVLVEGCKTRFSGVPIEVPDEAFSRLTFHPQTEVEAQGESGRRLGALCLY